MSRPSCRRGCRAGVKQQRLLRTQRNTRCPWTEAHPCRADRRLILHAPKPSGVWLLLSVFYLRLSLKKPCCIFLSAEITAAPQKLRRGDMKNAVFQYIVCKYPAGDTKLSVKVFCLYHFYQLVPVVFAEVVYHRIGYIINNSAYHRAFNSKQSYITAVNFQHRFIVRFA